MITKKKRKQSLLKSFVFWNRMNIGANAEQGYKTEGGGAPMKITTSLRSCKSKNIVCLYDVSRDS